MPIYRSHEGELIAPPQLDVLKRTELGAGSFGVDAILGGPGPFREFKPVEFGRPLSIVIRRIYTGRFPEEHLFSDRKPMLISTSVKDISTTSAGIRALNVLKKDVRPRSAFSGAGAAEHGTNLVYYSPAVASPFITVGMTMTFQDFDSDLFDRLSKLFSAAAGVPVFMPAASYLMAASSLVKLGGEVGDSILNGHPVMDENIQLDFSFGGGGLPTPGFWILSAGTLDASEYQFDPTKGLTQKSDGSPYKGADPVVVITIDGTAVEGVSNFTPLLASSSILARFFNQKENSEVATDTLLDAAKLVNDLTFRKKAEETKAKLAQLSSDDPQRRALQDMLSAFNQNIGERRLQLPTQAATKITSELDAPAVLERETLPCS